MNILWITPKPIKKQNNTFTADMASTRYRVLIPAKYLETKQYKQTFVSLDDNPSLKKITPLIAQQDIIVFSKSFNPVFNQQVAILAKKMNARIVFDICDNHFETPELYTHYKNMIYMADIVTANTEAMSRIVQQHTKRQAAVIPDPYEGEYKPAHFQPVGNQLNLLWFGSNTNLQSLESILPELSKLNQNISIKLSIVTAKSAQLESIYNQLNKLSIPFQFASWSIKTTQQAIQQSDIIVIPSLLNDRTKVKSSNRMVEPLWAGRFVVAHPLPAYKPFAQWAWVNEKLSDGIYWALQNPTQVAKNIEAAQHHIAQSYSPKRIGFLWDKLLNLCLEMEK
ncbi:hypothetical protein [Candidatus Albibeggiatoa sp. nov. NOAA]|uniref:glycosyltransferase n=1 Tax=Candidatus Albibeggiatoa sp. nov. NOAA TaxID=3162724 RepID=UPI0032F13B03|nr:hypothetical protein [Thiotrichaceae bacterium]